MRNIILKFLISLVLMLALTSCNFNALSNQAGSATGIVLYEPADGAHYQIGDLVKARSLLRAADGVQRIELLVNGSVYRTEHPNPQLSAGTLLQPWQATEAGSYTLQTRMTTNSGVVLESAVITVHVGAIENTPATPPSTGIPTLTETLTPTLTPSITPTPTLGPPMATANTSANCRYGPGDVYDVISYLLNEQSSLIVGRNAQLNWWVIQRVDGNGTCWVWDGVVTVSGDTSNVPIWPDPPTPTPSPTLTPIPQPLTAPSPTSPTGTLKCADVTGGATLTWSAISHSNGIDHYEWELSGPTSETGSAPNTQTQANTLGLYCSGANYQWRVRAVDGKGNVGPWSGYAVFNIP